MAGIITNVALDAGRMTADPTLAEHFRTAYRQAVVRINRNPEAYKTLLVEGTRFPLPIKDRYFDRIREVRRVMEA